MADPFDPSRYFAPRPGETPPPAPGGLPPLAPGLGGFDPSQYFDPPPPPPAPGVLSRAWDTTKNIYNAVEQAPVVAGMYAMGGPFREAALSAPAEDLPTLHELAAPPEQPAETYLGAAGRAISGEALGVLGSPTQMAMLGGLGALGRMASPAAQAASRLVSAGFAAQMAPGVYEGGKQAYQSFQDEGFTPKTVEEVIGTGIGAGMTGMAALHAARPRGPVSTGEHPAPFDTEFTPEVVAPPGVTGREMEWSPRTLEPKPPPAPMTDLDYGPLVGEKVEAPFVAPEQPFQIPPTEPYPVYPFPPPGEVAAPPTVPEAQQIPLEMNPRPAVPPPPAEQLPLEFAQEAPPQAPPPAPPEVPPAPVAPPVVEAPPAPPVVPSAPVGVEAAAVPPQPREAGPSAPVVEPAPGTAAAPTPPISEPTPVQAAPPSIIEDLPKPTDPKLPHLWQDEIVAEVTSKIPPSTPFGQVPTEFIQSLKERGDAALKRLGLMDQTSPQVMGPGGIVDPARFVAMLDYGLSRAAEHGLKGYNSWAAEMEAKIGPRVRPVLKQIWDQVSRALGWTAEVGSTVGPGRGNPPVHAVRGLAARYMKEQGRNPDYDHRTKETVSVDVNRAAKIADLYEAGKHDPNNPEVKASYEALNAETLAMYEFAKKEGYTFDFVKENPYKTSAEMGKDVRENKHLSAFSTEAGYGPGGAEAPDHPMLQRAPNGLLYNDMFRAVHDLFAHAKEGHEFGPKGEENAWIEHYRMFSPEARPAMTSETRGQNSWVNFGEHLRVPWAGEGSPLRPLFERMAEPDGGFSYSPAGKSEPKAGFAVSIYPDRVVTKPVGELTREDLSAFVIKNKDILGQPDHHLGAWHDPETGQVHLDISVVVSDRARAESLGRQHDQLAYHDILEGKSVRLEPHDRFAEAQAKSAPPAGHLPGEPGRPVPVADRAGPDTRGAGPGEGGPGAGEPAQPRAPAREVTHPPLDTSPFERVPKRGEPGFVPPQDRPFAPQKAMLLPEEFRTAPEAKPRGPEPANRTWEKLGVKGTGPGGSATIADIWEAVHKRTLKREGILSLKDTAKLYERAMKQGREDLGYQLEQQNPGTYWYTKDMDKTFEILREAHPEIADPVKGSLFKFIMTGLSYGNEIPPNLKYATEIWERWKDEGKLPLMQKDGVTNYPGQPSWADTGEKLQRLLTKFDGDEAKVVDWLHAQHPAAEINQYIGEDLQKVEQSEGGTAPGWRILGPKGDAFARNMHGDTEALTADRWWGRTYNRWIGALTDTPKAIQSPRTPTERALMQRIAKNLGREFGLTVPEVQATLWSYEKQRYSDLGVESSGEGYSVEARRLVDEKLAARRGAVDTESRTSPADAGDLRPAEARGEAPTAGEGPETYPTGGRDAPALPRGERGGTLEEGLSKLIDENKPAYSWLDREADAAAERLRTTSSRPQAQMGADPAILKDASLVGARWIRDGVRTLAEFTSKLVSQFGSGIAAIARQVWDGAVGLLRERGSPPVPETTPPGGPTSTAPSPLGEAPAPASPRPIRPIPPGVNTRGASAEGAGKAPREPVFNPRGAEAGSPKPPTEEASRAAAEAFTSKEPPPAEGKPGGIPESDINVARISPDEWVQQAVARAVGAAPDYFGKEEGGARGAIRTHDEVRSQAVALGFTEAEIKQAYKNKGGMLSDVEMEGARIAADQITKKAQAHYERAQELRKENQPGAAEDQDILYAAEITKLMTVHSVLIGAKAEAARALGSARMLGKGLDPTESAFQRWIASKEGMSETFRREFYDAIVKKDGKRIQELRRELQKSGFWEKVVEGWKAGLVSPIPTQVVNFSSNAGKILGFEPAEAAVQGGIDWLRGVPNAQRRAFAGEAGAMYHGAWRGLDFALHGQESQGVSGLLPALKEIFTLKYEAGEARRGLTRGTLGEEGKFENIGKIGGKTGEAIRIPFQVLNAADAFWKSIAGNQELYRQAYRDGKKLSYSGDALRSHTADFVTKYVAGTHPRQAELRAIIANAQVKGTFQEASGPVTRAAQGFSRVHPFASFVLPFIRTPANIAKATLRRTPLGIAEAVYRKLRADPEMTPELFQERLAQGIVGTTIASAIYLMAKDGALQFTGGGPVDPKDKQNLIDTGWLPYSLKVGNRYFSYQRIEPISSIIGAAADARELKDTKGASDKISKMAALIGENLTNKTFLSGLEGFTSALHDPVRYGEAFIKQLEGSFVPGIVGKAAQAIDPKVRKSKPFQTTYGVPEPIAARIPFLSQTLEEKKTPTGAARERPASGLAQFLNPFQTSVEKTTPVAALQREFSRIGYIPGDPTDSLRVSGGGKVDLTEEEFKIVQQANEEATKRAARMVVSPGWKDLDPDRQESLLRSAYSQAKSRSRARLYQRPDFRRRAALAQKAHKESRG